MTFLLMELARRPELQARVAAEARKVLEAKKVGDDGSGSGAASGTRAMTYDDLYEMPLLTKCINETLRLYPAVAYGSQRMLEKDTELHCGPGKCEQKTTRLHRAYRVHVCYRTCSRESIEKDAGGVHSVCGGLLLLLFFFC